MNVDVVCRDDLGRRGGEVLGHKSPIEADHDPTIGATVTDDPLGNGLRAHAHRIERVLLGDARAPAVGAEDDVHKLGGRCPPAPTVFGIAALQ